MGQSDVHGGGGQKGVQHPVPCVVLKLSFQSEPCVPLTSHGIQGDIIVLI